MRHLSYHSNLLLKIIYHSVFAGYHENIVGYYTSWFENDKLYIQMELCDHSLSVQRTKLFTEGEILEILYQVITFHWILKQVVLGNAQFALFM